MTMTMKNEMNKKGNNWKKNLKYSLITTKCILISIDCTNNLQPPQIKPLFGTITWNPSSWCSLRIQILDRNQWMSFGGCRVWWRYLKEMPTLKKPSQVLSISSKLLSPPWNLLDIFSWDFHQNFFFISLPHLTIEQVSADEEKKVSGDDKFTCWFSSLHCWVSASGNSYQWNEISHQIFPLCRWLFWKDRREGGVWGLSTEVEWNYRIPTFVMQSSENWIKDDDIKQIASASGSRSRESFTGQWFCEWNSLCGENLSDVI